MTYAIDSNVILDVFYNDPTFAQHSVDALTKASQHGDLIAHALEKADALIARDRGFLRDYFSTLQIIDPSRERTNL